MRRDQSRVILVALFRDPIPDHHPSRLLSPIGIAGPWTGWCASTCWLMSGRAVEGRMRRPITLLPCKTRHHHLGNRHVRPSSIRFLAWCRAGALRMTARWASPRPMNVPEGRSILCWPGEYGIRRPLSARSQCSSSSSRSRASRLIGCRDRHQLVCAQGAPVRRPSNRVASRH